MNDVDRKNVSADRRARAPVSAPSGYCDEVRFAVFRYFEYQAM